VLLVALAVTWWEPTRIKQEEGPRGGNMTLHLSFLARTWSNVSSRLPTAALSLPMSCHEHIRRMAWHSTHVWEFFTVRVCLGRSSRLHTAGAPARVSMSSARSFSLANVTPCIQ